MIFSRLAQLQQHLFAWGMAQANAANTHAIKLIACREHHNLGDLKQALLGNLQGKVLEIGPGAGANFAYYSPDIDWIGIEPNPFMHSYLHQEADRQKFPKINLHAGTAETLPVEDNSIDAVVSTHVLCSVTHLEKVITEIQRVLKPGGQFIFLEHVAASCGTRTRRIQNSITPLWKILFDNCHPNRETGQVLEAAGFNSVRYENFQLRFPIVGPHIAGIATKSATQP